MTTGVPDSGSMSTLAVTPKTSAMTSGVTTSAGDPSATIRAVAHGDEVVGVAGSHREVVQHHDDRRAASGIEIGDEVEHVELVGDVEEGRRLVEEQHRRRLRQRHREPHPLPLAAREAVDRHAPPGARRSVSTSAAATASSSARAQVRNSPWCGCRPRSTSSSTVTPSGTIGCCGSSPRRRATSLGRQRRRSPRRRAAPTHRAA